MKSDELAETKADLDAFVQDVFASLPRADQRGEGNLYLHGLMLDGRRKLMQPMGGRLGVDYQQLGLRRGEQDRLHEVAGHPQR